MRRPLTSSSARAAAELHSRGSWQDSYEEGPTAGAQLAEDCVRWQTCVLESPRARAIISATKASGRTLRAAPSKHRDSASAGPRISVPRGHVAISKRAVQTCNIFGGEAACKTLPQDSPFGKACAADRDDLKIDCVYWKDTEQNMHLDPSVTMAAALGDDYAALRQHCPQCLRNMQAMVRRPRHSTRPYLFGHIMEEAEIAEPALAQIYIR